MQPRALPTQTARSSQNFHAQVIASLMFPLTTGLQAYFPSLSLLLTHLPPGSAFPVLKMLAIRSSVQKKWYACPMLMFHMLIIVWVSSGNPTAAHQPLYVFATDTPAKCQQLPGCPFGCSDAEQHLYQAQITQVHPVMCSSAGVTVVELPGR